MMPETSGKGDREARKGMLQIYTGNGKGKTTAALGLALRACGHGWKVIMIQFMKSDVRYGEYRISQILPGFTLKQFGLSSFVVRGRATEEDRRAAASAMKLARQVIGDAIHDMVILDEINMALFFELISLDDVRKLVKIRPSWKELVLTGRSAHPDLIESADLVSEIREIKHPFYQGIQAREGIEY